MKAPSPAFSMYPKDILSDEHCTAMTHEEFGMYTRLLAHAWLEGSIPLDKVKLARMLKINVQKLDKVWPNIAPCWEVIQDPQASGAGRGVQLRLEEERTKQAERAHHQSVRGRKGGRPKKSTKKETRGLSGEKPDDTPAIPEKTLASPSPSPSPSPSAVTDNPEQQPLLPEALGTSSPTHGRVRQKIDAEAPTTRVIQAFNALQAKRLQVRGGWLKVVGDVVRAGYSTEDMLVAIYAAKHSGDPWYQGIAQEGRLDLLLRFKGGNNPTTGKDAIAHLDVLLGRVTEIDMNGLVLLDLDKVEGIEEILRRRGAREMHKPLPTNLNFKVRDELERHRQNRARPVA